jgi:2-dehydro-3-deoxy-D-arabinonate dehydratase
MKVYRTTQGIVVQKGSKYFLLKNERWDTFINDDNLYSKVETITQKIKGDLEAGILTKSGVLPPIESQEIWAAGVTYYRSNIGSQVESTTSGGGDFYVGVYEAKRPELFFKSAAHRTAGPGDRVRIRKDSTWNVPEPELTLAITSSGKIVGYTIGNDMSSRSIEGENPLYLPQAKCYDKSAAIGPCIFVTDKPLSQETEIKIEIVRNTTVFEGSISVNQIKRSFQDLVYYLYMESSFPHGCLLMTGTGIVPPNDFTLEKGDVIRISIEPIGTLINTVE